MTLNLQPPKAQVLKPQITVFGVGGAGGNATNNMIRRNLEGATFVVANTDAQALEESIAEKKIQLGRHTTQGLGAGATPEVGASAAEEAQEEIKEHLQGANMVFITAGMGGGTGTGAAPVIAKAAKDAGILTVGVVTKPFHFEGPRRMRLAEEGIEEMQKYVDTLIIIPNQNLFRVANEKTTFADAFAMADEVLHAGVRGVTDLMVMPGLINLDFADVRSVMSEMGKAMMGTGEAEGEHRAQEAAEAAISNPLLDNVSMKGARGVLINITGGPDMTLFEVDEAANRIRQEVDPDANIIFGSTFNEELAGKIRVSVVATGIDAAAIAALLEEIHRKEQQSQEVATTAESDELPSDLQENNTLQEVSAELGEEEQAPVVEAKVFMGDATPIAMPSELSSTEGASESESNMSAEEELKAESSEEDLSEDALEAPLDEDEDDKPRFGSGFFNKVAAVAKQWQQKPEEESESHDEIEEVQSSMELPLDTPSENVSSAELANENEKPEEDASSQAPLAPTLKTTSQEVAAEDTDEDVMDIPAFLRRKQANDQ